MLILIIYTPPHSVDTFWEFHYTCRLVGLVETSGFASCSARPSTGLQREWKVGMVLPDLQQHQRLHSPAGPAVGHPDVEGHLQA